MKSSLWTFANVASTVCVSDDAVSAVCDLNNHWLIQDSHAKKYVFH